MDNPTINLSLSVPDEIAIDQVKQGGAPFVQQLLEDQPTLEWLADHLSKRLDYLLGMRTPDPSIKAHRGEELIQICGRVRGVVTVGDLSRLNKIKAAGQLLSPLDRTKIEVIKNLQAYFQDNGNPETQQK